MLFESRLSLFQQLCNYIFFWVSQNIFDIHCIAITQLFDQILEFLSAFTTFI
uniref:Uncharacterized protein n=1 Tax=Helianthus annuus TaxID=4232 RepID=A0A251SJD9_HELAN